MTHPDDSQADIPGGLIGGAGVPPSSTVFGNHPQPQAAGSPELTTNELLAKTDLAVGFEIDLEVANRLLKEAYEIGCKRGDGLGKCEDCCRYCGCCVTHRASNDETHEPDCLWPVIGGFLKDQGVL